MPFNGTGTFSLTPTSVAPAVSNTTISSTDFNTTTADIVTNGLNKALCRDGQANPTANLPMATYRHTGVGNAAAATDYAAAGQVQAGLMTYAATSVGTDAYAITVTPSIAAYAAGMRFQALIDVANTGACTLAVSGLAAVAIKTQDGADPLTNTILATSVIDVIHDGTNFVLMSPIGGNINIAKITGSTSTGYAAEFNYTGTTNTNAALFARVTSATGNSYSVHGINASATGFAFVGEATHTTGINYGVYGETSSSAGYAGYFTATAVGGIPIQGIAANVANTNHAAILIKGSNTLNLNPKAAAASHNPITQLNDQVITSSGAAGIIDTGVLTLAPYATDAVGIRIDSTVDTVTISGTTNITDLTITAPTIKSEGSESIAGSGGTWVPAAGIYNFAASTSFTTAGLNMQIYVSSAWRDNIDAPIVICDGTNMRFINDTLGALTVYYQKF